MARTPGAIPPDAATRADELAGQIRYHRERYYRDDEPEISDAEFDELVRELSALADAAPRARHAPTHRSTEVGAPPSATFAPVRHIVADAVARQRVRTARSSPPGTRASSG